MSQNYTFLGHTARVLHTALSPDGTTVCSAAVDETLRFWDIWEPSGKKGKDNIFSKQSALNLFIIKHSITEVSQPSM